MIFVLILCIYKLVKTRSKGLPDVGADKFEVNTSEKNEYNLHNR